MKKNSLKLNAGLLVLIVCLNFFGTVPVQGQIRYNDVKETNWFSKDVNNLTSLNILSGYADGSFRPGQMMKTGEFIKTIIMASKLQYIKPAKTGHWALPYVEKALELGFVLPGEFENYDKEITRGEMSNIIARALPIVGTESYSAESVWERYEVLIDDYYLIKSGQKDNVLKVYSKGVIGGYPDGTFRADASLSRAETCAVINRMINSSQRLALKSISEETWTTYQNRTLVVEGVTIKPGMDILPSGNIKKEIVQALWEVAFNKLTFYRDQNTGKLKCSGYVPKAPQGYTAELAINISYSDPVIPGKYETLYYSIGTNSMHNSLTHYKVSEGEYFDYEILGETEDMISFLVIYRLIEVGEQSAPTAVYLDYVNRMYVLAYGTDESIEDTEDLKIDWAEKFTWLNEK